jgi:hypothetical protein
MVGEAQLDHTPHGVARVSHGWVVVNARDACWRRARLRDELLADDALARERRLSRYPYVAER